MNNTIDQQFIEYIVKSLVSNPDAVKIERRIDEKGVLLELSVDPEDLGRVIGKRGATAQSLRTLLRALGTKQDARYNLKIIDPNNNRDGSDYHENHRHDDYQGHREEEHTEKQEEDQHPEPDAEASSEAETPEIEDSHEETAESAEETEHSDRISQTRKELADLDDLDV